MDLLYEVKNHIAWVTINREKQKNAISMDAIQRFLTYLDQAEEDQKVRAVCLTGAGDKVFCSGADLGSAMGEAPDKKAMMFGQYARLLTRISQFPKPTLAKINGHCLAGGTGFMLACDIVIAREDVLFGTPEVNVGLFPMMIGALIFRNVLRKKAMEMILLGERLTAAQALEMGMVTRVVPKETLEGTTQEILMALAAKSPVGIRMGKQAFSAVEGMPLDKAVETLALKLGQVAATKDALEGITAFLEKRAPIFIGE
ncbi:MAG: enoyl-CoA hydratase/isomerase family protein [Proteobacteria bacterium]|nr:enoyl-CoA hydratase [Desulfobacula sp.]MBU3950745.1 enoyl-CoA hydratase/isomerase family protein [Pseudomonadota bacterium]MBU4131336.1 enoyl-CoA hydratase/isomerase family protein [Pseudomonadota bacterium]